MADKTNIKEEEKSKFNVDLGLHMRLNDRSFDRELHGNSVCTVYSIDLIVDNNKDVHSLCCRSLLFMEKNFLFNVAATCCSA